MNTFEMTYRTVDNMQQSVRFRYSENLDEMCQFLTKVIAKQGVASFPSADDPNSALILNFSTVQVKTISLMLIFGDDCEYTQ